MEFLTGIIIMTATVCTIVVILLCKGYDWKSKSAGNSINR